MKSTDITTIFLLFVLPLASCETELLPPYEDEIVGGTEVPPDTYPWYAVANYPSAVCGGSLIDQSGWVLTAAHCQDAFDNGVRIGVQNIADPNDGIVRQVIKRFPHPSYKQKTTANDIMLLQLSEPVDSSVLTPVPSGSAKLPTDGTELVVLGFGRTSYGGETSDVLLQVDVNAMSDSVGIAQYGARAFKPSVMFCAGSLGGGKDACHGDSGSPIIDKATNEQVGIVSWGNGCGEADYYGVYTRVSAFSDWIACVIDTSTNCRGGGGKGNDDKGNGGGKGKGKNKSGGPPGLRYLLNSNTTFLDQDNHRDRELDKGFRFLRRRALPNN